MRAMTMQTTAFGTLVLAAALSTTWIGCATEVSPQNGTEKTGESSAAIYEPPPPPPPYTCPDSVANYWTIAYAKRHSASFVVPSGMGPYTDVAPTPCTGYGSLFSCASQPGIDIHNYEEALAQQVPDSNLFEYKVVIPAIDSQHYYLLVGINQASVGRATTPPPWPGFAPGGSPSNTDYDAEAALVSGSLNTSNVQAYTHPFECVAVYTEDLPHRLITTFVEADGHDPDGGDGW